MVSDKKIVRMSRRIVILTTFTFICFSLVYRNSEYILIPGTTTCASTNSCSKKVDVKTKELAKQKTTPHIQTYFDQVFSPDPLQYEFPALSEQCARTKWEEEEVYLKCSGMAAGMTSIMSQVKVCLKMAVETGTHLMLPAMPLRDSKDLTEFNFLNEDAYLTYDKWFDVDHFTQSMARVCPDMKILHPDRIGEDVQVKFDWFVDIGKQPGYKAFQSYFWSGRPFKTFFEDRYKELQLAAFLDPQRDDTKQGITVVRVDSQFLLYRITDDPTGYDLKLWNDLGHLIRFKEEPRKIVAGILQKMTRPFYGVHFRVESDTIWSPLENQLKVDLNALDEAWAKYGKPDAKKPLVYLACGDQNGIEKFIAAAAKRGWEVTHKWALADRAMKSAIDKMTFDFQGAVDMGVMLRSEFFFGITGSAFSSTVGNARDETGRYRGSSFKVWDDAGARTHLFNDGDADKYPCCL